MDAAESEEFSYTPIVVQELLAVEADFAYQVQLSKFVPEALRVAVPESVADASGLIIAADANEISRVENSIAENKINIFLLILLS